MKKISNIAVIISILILSVIPMVGLINSADAANQYYEVTNTPKPRDIYGWMYTVDVIVQWIYTIFLIAAVVFVLIAAFQYLTSGGDKEKVKKATNMLMYAAIAVVVAILAFSITRVVGSLVGEPNV